MIKEQLAQELQKKKWTLATAESCTGGLLSSLFTQISGSSQWFEGAIVSYSNRAKQHLLGVPEQILSKYGAVSKETALAMAQGIHNQFNTQLGIAITGIAGPGGGSQEKPVGLVHFGFYIEQYSWAVECIFSGNRLEIQQQAALFAIDEIYSRLKEIK